MILQTTHGFRAMQTSRGFHVVAAINDLLIATTHVRFMIN